ncbi:WD repeat domain-containing protein 83 isoform X1 [Scaptodrosophila lebanonensis]|uniref:WD repeat domain-containing protein 83 n=2 Tax=Drosophila lebanonensis TaxID=7225 RepID=A0A6J2U571_DROLE|nr:WD repeat domain-containing protein 83 isoform X1 [Scaptodrosophila lebanonensis]
MPAAFVDFQCGRTIDCKQGAVRAVRYNVDGSYCLSCGSDKKVKLWNPASGLLLKTYGGHADEVTDVSGSCDSNHIVSSSLDRSIIYWDVSTGLPVRRLRSHAGGVRCVRFNEDSSIAISGGRDNAVMCWDIRTRRLEPVQVMKEARDCITTVLTNDHKIFAASLDGCVRHYDIRVGEMTCDKIGEPVTYLALTRDEQCLVAGCQDSVVRLLDCSTGELLNEYKGHQADDYHIECGIMASDAQVVAGSSEGCAYVWDLLEGKVVQRITISDNGGVVHSLATHPKRQELLFARRRDIYVYSTDVEIIVEEI